MNEKEFLQKIKEIKVIVPDEQFFLEYNSVVYSILKENQQLKEQLEASERARKILKEINEYRKETGGYPSEVLDKLLDILDIDKGE